MKKDILSPADIEKLVRAFYEKINADAVLGPVFNDKAHTNWEKHIPVMCRFWENAILFESSYEGNPMELHKHLHRVMPLDATHFQQWNHLFLETVDELFTGENARRAKQHSLKISAVLQSAILPVPLSR